MIDQRSRYPIVAFTNNTTAKNFTNICNDTFAHFGNPETLVSDNGPPFRSSEVKRYMEKRSIYHRRVTPLWPQANGEVERFMLPLTKIICTAHIENRSFAEEVLNFLMAYRIAPHSTTNIPPADLMYNYKIQCAIPDFISNVDDSIEFQLNKK
ncbi:uncharacterized protein K02A2.6-like [Hydractinia symbiolongicarpus]|uniref:uncharacterized protein K02A2.6-like n=1 Tax=Hydractinia symbiolongicarpus TaxID=13093 RepID=UPI00254B5D31|nr:uncharacterized protein K02A2.6-like [Hydractinia symbiolongicarpus]